MYNYTLQQLQVIQYSWQSFQRTSNHSAIPKHFIISCTHYAQLLLRNYIQCCVISEVRMTTLFHINTLNYMYALLSYTYLKYFLLNERGWYYRKLIKCKHMCASNALFSMKGGGTIAN